MGPMVVSNLNDVLKAFAKGLIFGQEFGSGAPQVLWLHGWQRSSADFVAAAELLAAEGIASIALDLPGFGASPLPDRPGGAALYADLVMPVIEANFAERPFLIVGHSFGGRVAAELASRHVQGLRGLVFTGVPLLRRTASPRKSPWRYRLIKRLSALGMVSADRLEAAKQQYGSADYRAASGLLRDILVTTVAETYEAQLGAISVPVALVWGELDTDVPVLVAERAISLLTSPTTLTVLEGIGHLVPSQAPALLADVVREALA